MKVFISILFLGIYCQIFAQVYEIDLSKKDTKRETIESGSNITIRVINRLWNRGYEVSVVKKLTLIDDIVLPANTDGVGAATAVPYTDLNNSNDVLKAVLDERDIPDHIKKIIK